MDWTHTILGPAPYAGVMDLASKYFDLGTSVLTLLIFIMPVCVHLARTRAASHHSRLS